MNTKQFFGVAVFSVGAIMLLLASLALPFVEEFVGVFLLAGIFCMLFGTAIILVFLISERIRDFGKDKKTFSKMEGRK